MANRIVFLVVGSWAVLASACATGPRLPPQAQIAKATEGRVAGTPVNCISMPLVQSSYIVDGTAIIYDAGSTIYVNYPTAGAETMRSDDIQVTKTFGQLCSIDVVRLFNRTMRAPRGFVNLGKFVPYKRVPKGT